MLVCISHSDYMTWMSVIVAVLSLLVLLLIGWQIWNYIVFEKKVDSKIKHKLDEAEKRLKEESEKVIATYSYFSYLSSAASHHNSFGWELDVVLDNLGLGIVCIVELKNYDTTILDPLFDEVEILCKNNDFGTNYKKYAIGVDRFIPTFKKLLSKDERVYDLLKEIEKQRDNRGELID